MNEHYEKYKASYELYREKNREALNEKSRQYYYDHREAVLKKSEKYRGENKRKISERAAIKRLSDPGRFEKNRVRHKAWSTKNREKLNEYQRKWYQNNKEKRRAHVVLHRAVKKGIIERSKTCEQCGKLAKTDGHHEDYSKPLEVKWLCKPCHMRQSPRTVIKI